MCECGQREMVCACVCACVCVHMCVHMKCLFVYCVCCVEILSIHRSNHIWSSGGITLQLLKITSFQANMLSTAIMMGLCCVAN